MLTNGKEPAYSHRHESNGQQSRATDIFNSSKCVLVLASEDVALTLNSYLSRYGCDLEFKFLSEFRSASDDLNIFRH